MSEQNADPASSEGADAKVPKLGRPEYCEPSRFLKLASYCGEDNPEGCSAARPCAECLNMSNVFGEDGKYIGTVDRDTPYRAELDEAKARANSRQDQIDELEDSLAARDAEIATLRAALEKIADTSNWSTDQKVQIAVDALANLKAPTP